MSTKSRTSIATAAILAATAIAAPSAGAYTLPGGATPSAHHGSTPAVVRTAEPPSSGFDWGDAGVGAAGVITLLGLGGGGALFARRTRRSHAAVS